MGQGAGGLELRASLCGSGVLGKPFFSLGLSLSIKRG